MSHKTLATTMLCLALALSTTGCQSPYRADRGALAGGLLGAGTGAIIGDAMGNAGAGAAIGAGVGALSGAVIGSELDQIEASNRAAISRQLGRQVSANAVTVEDVIAMSEAGVDDELIVSHVRAHGMTTPPCDSDLITLTERNVSTSVIKAMQEPPRRPVVVRRSAPAPIVVEEYHYGAPAWGCYHPPPRPVYRHRHARPGLSWGVSVRH